MRKLTIVLGILAMGWAGWSVNPSVAQSLAPSQRLDNDIKYLASDELEGREPGSEGIEKAAQYIIDTWKEFGVPGGAEDGSYRQDFQVNLGVVPDQEKTDLVLKGPDESMKLNFQDQFQPLLAGGDGEIESADLVFVGYGIQDDENNYNEYMDVDVEGKVVVVLRMEPQQEDEDSVFDGKENSPHASISRKLALAQEAGAVAMILVNDGVRGSDELVQSDLFGAPKEESIPFFQVKRSVINQVLSTSPIVAPPGGELNNLDDIEARIDDYLEPLSQPIEGWEASGTTSFSVSEVTTSNIVGVIEGQGPNADETIVIGGHYDHLGFGGRGSRVRGQLVIHNGADDNATGTAGVVELARRFAQADEKPGRRLVFIAFSGEERGLLGSDYYVDNPLYPLEKTVAMINYDMIGRLRDRKLTIYGTGSGDNFDKICESVNDPENPLELNKIPSPAAGSDHLVFVRKQIPVLFLHTGLTNVYHTPDDDYETLNIEGANEVVDYTERLIRKLANAEEAPEFVEVARPNRRRRPAYFWVRLDYEADDRGPRIDEAPDEAPAATAGLKVGDIIVSMDGEKISDRQELSSFLRSNQPGTEVEVKFIRDNEEMTTTVKLGRFPRPNRDDDDDEDEGNEQEKKEGENQKEDDDDDEDDG